MNKMSTSQLSARINRFMDSKKARMVDLSIITEPRMRRTHRQHIDVSHTPFIALAIK